MVWTFICSARWILPLAFEVKLASQTHGSLVHYNFMADGNPILAALELKAQDAARHWLFRVSDIVLTAQCSPEALARSTSSWMLSASL
jgi:hypothetical protein